MNDSGDNHHLHNDGCGDYDKDKVKGDNDDGGGGSEGDGCGGDKELNKLQFWKLTCWVCMPIHNRRNIPG